MTGRLTDDAAAAAARRAEAQRRIQEQKSPAEAQKAAAAAKAKLAKGSTPPKQLKNDEFSTGKAKALRMKALGGSALEVRSIAALALGRAKPPTPAEQAQTDADRIEDLAKTDPAKAADTLRTSLESPDPEYRAALLDHSEDLTKAIVGGLKNAKPEVIQATVISLGKAGQAAGPEGAQKLGADVAKALEGGIGGFDKLGDLGFPKSPGSAAFLNAMLTQPGFGDFVTGMIAGAKDKGNLALLRDLSDLVEVSAGMANRAFEDASNTVDQLNAALSSLVQGFGPGDEAKLQAAVASFKERHKDEYAKFEAAGAALTNVAELAGPILEQGEGNLDFGLATKLLKTLSLVPRALATQAGQAELARGLEAQSRGEDSPLLDTLEKLTEGDKGDEIRAQLTPLITQAIGTRVTALKADGRLDEAHALIDTLGKNAKLFGVDPSKLGDVESAMHDTLDGKPGALEALNLAVSSVSSLVPETSSLVPSLKGLGVVLGVAGLPEQFSSFSDAELQDQIGIISSALGLSSDAAALAIKTLAAPGTQAALESLLGKVSAGAGVVGALVGVVDFAQTAGAGPVGDVAVSGLNAASGILLLIPGGQIAGVGLAIASFVLSGFLADRRQREAEHASEADAKAFLLAAGLSPEFAKVFSNLNNDKENIGVFVEEVAKKLGLTRDELFAKLNASKGKDREQLLESFGGLSAIAEISAEFDDGGKFPIFGPRITLDDLEGLPDFVSEKNKQKIVDRINARRDEIIAKLAGTIEPLLD